MEKTKVIIDTDPGIDDAMAIFLALGAPNISVEGLTIVHGNSTDVEKLGRNACVILETANRPDIPVHIGAYAPMTREDNKGAEFVHGQNCLGDVEFPAPNKTALTPHHSAVPFIISKVLDNPNEIVLIALGPLTNIALAMKLLPTLPKLVKSLVIMGGAVFVPGNSTPVAEANIHGDPEAARVVLNAEWNGLITVAALDITEKIRMHQNDFDVLRDLNKTGKFIFDVVKFCQKYYIDVVKTEDFPVHDATAVMAVVNPDLFTAQTLYVDVETKGEITRGMTVPYVGPEFSIDKKPNIKLLDGADPKKVIEEYTKIIKNLP